MAHTNRYSRLAWLTALCVTLSFGCQKSAVTGNGVMPDNANLSPAQKRQAMVQWHQQHDKPATGTGTQSGQ